MPSTAVPISSPHWCRCAAHSRLTISVSLHTCSRSVTAAPARPARRLHCCAIQAGCDPISAAQTLDRYLDHYQEVWAKAADAAPGEVAQAQPNAMLPRKLVNIDFPSAASIPPVSIMNPEPTGPVLPGVAAAAAANPNPQAAAPASRHSRKPAANPPAQTLAQPAPAGSGAVEPIWPEPVPPPPPPRTAAAPAGAPVQLNPPSPSASAGGPVRAQ